MGSPQEGRAEVRRFRAQECLPGLWTLHPLLQGNLTWTRKRQIRPLLPHHRVHHQRLQLRVVKIEVLVCDLQPFRKTVLLLQIEIETVKGIVPRPELTIAHMVNISFPLWLCFLSVFFCVPSNLFFVYLKGDRDRGYDRGSDYRSGLFPFLITTGLFASH